MKLEPLAVKVDDALGRQMSNVRAWWPLVTWRRLEQAQRNAFELGRDAERLGL